MGVPLENYEKMNSQYKDINRNIYIVTNKINNSSNCDFHILTKQFSNKDGEGMNFRKNLQVYDTTILENTYVNNGRQQILSGTNEINQFRGNGVEKRVRNIEHNNLENHCNYALPKNTITNNVHTYLNNTRNIFFSSNNKHNIFNYHDIHRNNDINNNYINTNIYNIGVTTTNKNNKMCSNNGTTTKLKKKRGSYEEGNDTTQCNYNGNDVATDKRIKKDSYMSNSFYDMHVSEDITDNNTNSKKSTNNNNNDTNLLNGKNRYYEDGINDFQDHIGKNSQTDMQRNVHYYDHFAPHSLDTVDTCNKDKNINDEFSHDHENNTCCNIDNNDDKEKHSNNNNNKKKKKKKKKKNNSSDSSNNNNNNKNNNSDNSNNNNNSDVQFHEENLNRVQNNSSMFHFDDCCKIRNEKSNSPSTENDAFQLNMEEQHSCTSYETDNANSCHKMPNTFCEVYSYSGNPNEVSSTGNLLCNQMENIEKLDSNGIPNNILKKNEILNNMNIINNNIISNNIINNNVINTNIINGGIITSNLIQDKFTPNPNEVWKANKESTVDRNEQLFMCMNSQRKKEIVAAEMYKKIQNLMEKEREKKKEEMKHCNNNCNTNYFNSTTNINMYLIPHCTQDTKDVNVSTNYKILEPIKGSNMHQERYNLYNKYIYENSDDTNFSPQKNVQESIHEHSYVMPNVSTFHVNSSLKNSFETYRDCKNTVTQYDSEEQTNCAPHFNSGFKQNDIHTNTTQQKHLRCCQSIMDVNSTQKEVKGVTEDTSNDMQLAANMGPMQMVNKAYFSQDEKPKQTLEEEDEEDDEKEEIKENNAKEEKNAEREKEEEKAEMQKGNNMFSCILNQIKNFPFSNSYPAENNNDIIFDESLGNRYHGTDNKFDECYIPNNEKSAAKEDCITDESDKYCKTVDTNCYTNLNQQFTNGNVSKSGNMNFFENFVNHMENRNASSGITKLKNNNNKENLSDKQKILNMFNTQIPLENFNSDENCVEQNSNPFVLNCAQGMQQGENKAMWLSTLLHLQKTEGQTGNETIEQNVHVANGDKYEECIEQNVESNQAKITKQSELYEMNNINILPCNKKTHDENTSDETKESYLHTVDTNEGKIEGAKERELSVGSYGIPNDKGTEKSSCTSLLPGEKMSSSSHGHHELDTSVNTYENMEYNMSPPLTEKGKTDYLNEESNYFHDVIKFDNEQITKQQMKQQIEKQLEQRMEQQLEQQIRQQLELKMKQQTVEEVDGESNEKKLSNENTEKERCNRSTAQDTFENDTIPYVQKELVEIENESSNYKEKQPKEKIKTHKDIYASAKIINEIKNEMERYVVHAHLKQLAQKKRSDSDFDNEKDEEDENNINNNENNSNNINDTNNTGTPNNGTGGIKPIQPYVSKDSLSSFTVYNSSPNSSIKSCTEYTATCNSNCSFSMASTRRMSGLCQGEESGNEESRKKETEKDEDENKDYNIKIDNGLGENNTEIENCCEIDEDNRNNEEIITSHNNFNKCENYTYNENGMLHENQRTREDNGISARFDEYNNGNDKHITQNCYYYYYDQNEPRNQYEENQNDNNGMFYTGNTYDHSGNVCQNTKYLEQVNNYAMDVNIGMNNANMHMNMNVEKTFNTDKEATREEAKQRKKSGRRLTLFEKKLKTERKEIRKKEFYERALRQPKITGVSYDKKQNIWVSHWRYKCKTYHKYFSVKKYGFEKARNLAIICRIENTALCPTVATFVIPTKEPPYNYVLKKYLYSDGKLIFCGDKITYEEYQNEKGSEQNSDKENNGDFNDIITKENEIDENENEFVEKQIEENKKKKGKKKKKNAIIDDVNDTNKNKKTKSQMGIKLGDMVNKAPICDINGNTIYEISLLVNGNFFFQQTVNNEGNANLLHQMNQDKDLCMSEEKKEETHNMDIQRETYDDMVFFSENDKGPCKNLKEEKEEYGKTDSNDIKKVASHMKQNKTLNTYIYNGDNRNNEPFCNIADCTSGNNPYVLNQINMNNFRFPVLQGDLQCLMNANVNRNAINEIPFNNGHSVHGNVCGSVAAYEDLQKNKFMTNMINVVKENERGNKSENSFCEEYKNAYQKNQTKNEKSDANYEKDANVDFVKTNKNHTYANMNFKNINMLNMYYYNYLPSTYMNMPNKFMKDMYENQLRNNTVNALWISNKMREPSAMNITNQKQNICNNTKQNYGIATNYANNNNKKNNNNNNNNYNKDIYDNHNNNCDNFHKHNYRGDMDFASKLFKNDVNGNRNKLLLSKATTTNILCDILKNCIANCSPNFLKKFSNVKMIINRHIQIITGTNCLNIIKPYIILFKGLLEEKKLLHMLPVQVQEFYIQKLIHLPFNL